MTIHETPDHYTRVDLLMDQGTGLVPMVQPHQQEIESVVIHQKDQSVQNPQLLHHQALVSIETLGVPGVHTGATVPLAVTIQDQGVKNPGLLQQIDTGENTPPLGFWSPMRNLMTSVFIGLFASNIAYYFNSFPWAPTIK